jgi:hypothetical protein
MKEIILTQGKVALVDDEDFDRLNQYKWRAHKGTSTYYATRDERVGCKVHMIRMHRQILGAKPKQEIDHRDNNGLNNQTFNIRLCTKSENQCNTRKHNGMSIYKGVSWHKKTKKWRVCIKLNGKGQHIGYFNSELDAAKAYDIVAKKLFGEFARTNFTALPE